MSYQIRYLFTLIFGFLLFLLSSESSCVKQGSIESFTVQPSFICEGDTINISWTAKGNVELSASPASNVTFSATGTQPAEGSMTATVTGDAQITIQASGSSSSTSRMVNIELFRSGDHYRIGTFGECRGSTPTWEKVNPPADYSDRIRVDVVTSTVGDANIQVTHSARSVALPPLGSTAMFSGTLLEGDWSFYRELIPNPCREERTGALAGIAVDVSLTCGP